MSITITLNTNAIQQDTGKAVLVKIPSSDSAFWIPKKMARSGKGNTLRCWFPTGSWDVRVVRLSTKCDNAQQMTSQELADGFSGLEGKVS